MSADNVLIVDSVEFTDYEYIWGGMLKEIVSTVIRNKKGCKESKIPAKWTKLNIIDPVVMRIV